MLRLSAALATVCLALLLMANSGSSGDKGKKPKGMIPAGWKALKLSPDQENKIRDIDAVYDAKIAALQDQITEMKAMRTAEQVKHLTEDQKELLRKLAVGEGTKDKKGDKDKGDKDKKEK